MAEIAEFQKKQFAFAAHIRDPKNEPAPAGIEDRRMAVYRELFFNNLRSLLATMFPVLKKLHSTLQWNRLIRLFMRNHRAKTPYFLQLPNEFLDFLKNEYELRDDDFPFLLELAHYEYIEIALSISEESNDLHGIDPDGDLLANVPIKSVLTWVYAYQYPVHRISPKFLPEAPEAQPIFLAVYRNDDDKVNFLELNTMSAQLLDSIASNDKNLSGETLLFELAEKIEYAAVDSLLRHGASLLKEMRQLEILTGTRAPG